VADFNLVGCLGLGLIEWVGGTEMSLDEDDEERLSGDRYTGTFSGHTGSSLFLLICPLRQTVRVLRGEMDIGG